MTATVLDGRGLAAKIKDEVAAAVAAFKQSRGVVPAIAVVRAGEDPASVSYAKAIYRAFEAAGMKFALHSLPDSTSEAEVVGLVKRLSADPAVHGIMVQEPLPKHVSGEAVIEALNPAKDVDGVHPINAGRLMQGAGLYFVPATPAGGMEILKRHGVELKGKRAVVVGRSNIVGKPMAFLLLHQHATVTICHSRTIDLAGVCREADVLCAAVGRPHLVKGDWIKPGAIVIDFGVNFVDGKMFGDVDYAQAAEVAGAITPVPGGTGPMTNIMLMLNVLEAARRLTH